jgi:quercetin dioxygenase-like cupin family protein
VHSLWASLPDACDHPRVRVIKPEMRKPTKSVAEIFSGEVESFTAVGGEHSTDLRLSEIHFKSGARNRWHTHTTDQILMCTEGDGLIATDEEQHDLTPGVVVLIPKATRHWHGAKPGKNMTHWSILGPAETRIAD